MNVDMYILCGYAHFCGSVPVYEDDGVYLVTIVCVSGHLFDFIKFIFDVVQCTKQHCNCSNEFLLETN